MHQRRTGNTTRAKASTPPAREPSSPLPLPELMSGATEAASTASQMAEEARFEPSLIKGAAYSRFAKRIFDDEDFDSEGRLFPDSDEDSEPWQAKVNLFDSAVRSQNGLDLKCVDADKVADRKLVVYLPDGRDLYAKAVRCEGGSLVVASDPSREAPVSYIEAAQKLTAAGLRELRGEPPEPARRRKRVRLRLTDADLWEWSDLPRPGCLARAEDRAAPAASDFTL